MELTSLIRAAKTGSGSLPEISLSRTYGELNHTRAALSDLKGANQARFSEQVTSVMNQVGSLEKRVYEDKVAEAKRVSNTVSTALRYENKELNKLFAQLLGFSSPGKKGGSNIGTFIDKYA